MDGGCRRAAAGHCGSIVDGAHQPRRPADPFVNFGSNETYWRLLKVLELNGPRWWGGASVDGILRDSTRARSVRILKCSLSASNVRGGCAGAGGRRTDLTRL
jgi:hypothetical protein